MLRQKEQTALVREVGQDPKVKDQRWGIDPRTGDMYFKIGDGAWRYGTDRAKWTERGRDLIFGDQAGKVADAESAAIAQMRGQRGSLSFRKKTKRDESPVDAEIRTNTRMNTVLNERKPEATWRAETAKNTRSMFADLKNKIGYLEDIKDRPKFRNWIRLAQQDPYDAMETASVRMSHILEPIVKSPSSRRMLGKLVVLEDMLDRAKRPRGTEEEIAASVEDLVKAKKDLDAAINPEAKKEAAGRMANANRALKAKLKPLDNPLGFTPEELRTAHDELIQRATPGVLEALKRHRDDAWAMLDDGIKRGYFDPRLAARKGETYFPHYVISQADALVDFIPGLPATLREPFRGWSEHAVGSRKLIDFDYENRWKGHIIRTELANKIDDFMAKSLPYLDRMPEEGSDLYKRLFRQTDGSIPKPSELPYYSGGGGKKVSFSDPELGGGEPHVVFRYVPFRWRAVPKSKIMGMVQDSVLKEFSDPYLVPERAVKYLEVSRSPDNALWNEAWKRYVRVWKATQITAGGLSTRTVNTFGDFYQLYLEDFPAFLSTLPRMPAVMRAMFGTPRTAEEAEFAGLLKTHRITEGSTFFGPDAYRLRAAWREAAPDERMAMVLKHGFDLPGYVANALEVWPRVTKAYADFLRIKAGKELTSKVYSIKGLDPYEQMGVLARNTFVDYAAASEFHQKYLRAGMFPFLTWFQRTFNYTLGYSVKNPVNAMMKIGVPIAAMWLWNNVVNPDLERDQSPWVKRFPLHLVTNIPHPLNPHTKTTIVFPTGNDMALEVLQEPHIMERVAKFIRGERQDPLNLGWSPLAASMLNIATTLGEHLFDLSPISEAAESIWTNHDSRTGEPIVPDAYIGDKVAEAKFRANYLAMKSIPILDRVIQQIHKDEKRPGGAASTAYGHIYNALVAHGVFNPIYGPMTGFAFPHDPNVATINRLRNEMQPYNIERKEAGASFIDALADQMSGQPGAIQKWAQANRQAIPLMGPKALQGLLQSPQNLYDLFTNLEQRATTDAQREHWREMAARADKIRRMQAILSGPKGPAQATMMDELRRRMGIPAHPPERSLTGESIYP